MSAESAFRYTPVPLRKCPEAMGISEGSLWMGSCFTENLSPWLASLGYPVCSNPFGVVYHPLVMEKLLFATEAEFIPYHFCREGVWQNFLLGMPFACQSEHELNEMIAKAAESCRKALENSSWLLLTFGTAFLYEHKTLGPVGKCHKQPSEHFTKRLSTVEEISTLWKSAIEKLRNIRPGLRILLSLSPVRHSRDGMEENTLSKAVLRLAIEEIRSSTPSVYYFPAFELMNDELRDYRFYAADLLHPSAEAVDFLRKQFELRFLRAEDEAIRKLSSEIIRMRQHRPFAAWSEEADRWQEGLKNREEQLEFFRKNNLQQKK